MGKTGITGVRRVWNAMFYSFAGLGAALKHESAFRQECALALILVPIAFWVGTNVVEITLLVGSILIVLIVEMLNSALETVVDRIGSEQHDLSGRAKDMGSAAVFISLVLVVFVWGAMILQHVELI